MDSFCCFYDSSYALGGGAVELVCTALIEIRKDKREKEQKKDQEEFMEEWE